MATRTYTEEERAEALKKVEELGLRKAAKETGISMGSLTKWKNDAAMKAAGDQAVASSIEVTKGVRKAGRKAKETLEQVAADAAEQAAISSVEVKKSTARAGRKVKEAITDFAEQLQRDIALNIVIQSNSGNAITVAQIAKKVPAKTTDVYVKAEENKLYYVLKDGTTGSVEIWD